MASRDDTRLVVRGEVDRGNPVTVGSGVAEGDEGVAQNVPDTDSLVTAGGDNQVVVSREVAGQNVTLVADEAGGATVSKRPETHGAVPGGRENVLTILRDGDVLDDVAVAEERALGETNVLTVKGELPDDDAAVTGTGNKNVRLLGGNSEGSNPVVVALEGAAELQSLSAHFSMYVS